jgi:quinol monooxygenase YgiN
VHVFVRFDGKPGRLDELRSEVRGIIEPTRAEPGCLEIHLYEEKKASGTFFIHSKWKDDAAIDTHLQLPHMKRFRGLLDALTSNTVKAIRTQLLD